MRKLFDPQRFPAWGVAGCAVVLAATLVSAVAYRGRVGESFSPLNHFVSELGERGVSPLAVVFNVGLLAGGLLLAGFMVQFGRYLRGLGLFAGAVGAVSGLACALVGVFPMDDLPLHLAVATLFFRTGLFAVVLFTAALIFDRRRSLSRWLIAPGIATFLAFAVFLAAMSSVPVDFEALARLIRNRPDVLPIAVMEWAVFGTVLAWVGWISLAARAGIARRATGRRGPGGATAPAAAADEP
jgi:hypothetical membrane protein